MLKAILIIALSVLAMIQIFLVTFPVSVEAQLCIGLLIIVCMFIMKGSQNYVLRALFISLGAFITFRYAYWRVTSTLPSPSDLESFIPGVILMVAELFCILMFCLSSIIVFDLYRRPPRTLPKKLNIEELPTVAVFVPSYNEDPGLVAITLAAAVDLEYPKEKLNVYLLDDGGTDQKLYSADAAEANAAARRRDEFIEICERLGVQYIARQFNRNAKAGNLNYALSMTDSDLVVVFDADHAPSSEFLRETVGYFDDPKLFLVQTPHFFLNPDPIEKNLGTFSRMPSENDMFYRIIQKGLDKWDAAFFCGSAAVLRRAALDEVGGFAGISITEDCETALELHARGWSSAYVDKPMIAGLQPDTVASFMGQRSRWCRGMCQILLLKCPLFKPGLSFMQRLGYTATCLFWLFPFPRVIFMIAPILFVLFGLQIYSASIQEFIAYTVVYILATTLIQSGLYGRVRWPWISELYEYIQCIYLAPAIFSVILNPKAPTFNVTKKGEVLAKDQLSVIAWPFVVVFGLLLAVAFYFGWLMYQHSDQRALLALIGVWHLFNVILAGAALVAIFERRELRGAPRVATKRAGIFSVRDLRIPVEIDEANANGVLVVPQIPTLPQLRRGEVGTLKVLSPVSRAIVERKPAGNTGIHQENSVPTTLDAEEKNYDSTIKVELVAARNCSQGIGLGLAFRDSLDHRAQTAANLVHEDLTLIRRVHDQKLRGASIIVSAFNILRWFVIGTLRTPFRVLQQLRTVRSRRDSVPVNPPVNYALGEAEIPPLVEQAETLSIGK